MHKCEQVKVDYWVRATRDGREDGELFGPVSSRESAEDLLLVIAGRADIIRAQVVREVRDNG